MIFARIFIRHSRIDQRLSQPPVLQKKKKKKKKVLDKLLVTAQIVEKFFELLCEYDTFSDQFFYEVRKLLIQHYRLGLC